MPIYEYELIHDDCLMCPGRFDALQELGEEALKHCPSCGLPARRVVSQVSIKTRSSIDHEKAGKKGFTTWKRSGFGQWEKVSGPGVDAIVASDEDIAAVKEEKKRTGK